MKNLIKKTITAVNEKLNKLAVKLIILKQNFKRTLASNSGEGYLDTVIKLLIAIVLGALLLAGLYALFNDVVMPRLEKEVTDMFDYKG